jgi:hypothetical protein
MLCLLLSGWTKMRRNWRKGQLRLGWAGHARGRGMAAGCRYNSRLGKSFLIRGANENIDLN